MGKPEGRLRIREVKEKRREVNLGREVNKGKIG